MLEGRVMTGHMMRGMVAWVAMVAMVVVTVAAMMWGAAGPTAVLAGRGATTLVRAGLVGALVGHAAGTLQSH